MPSSAVYKLEIKCADANEFTLNSVISSPRTCTPLNLTAACRNVLIEEGGGDVPDLVFASAQFILTQFFTLAHRTGLYNRQRTLWESLGRVTMVEGHRLTEGFFQRAELPALDLFFKDGRSRMAVFAHILEDGQWLADDRKQKEHLKTILHRAEKLKSGKGLAGGIVLFYPAPIPNIVLTEIRRMTNFEDPIARYESLLPEPLSLAIDLVEYSHVETTSGETKIAMKLAHPELSVDRPHSPHPAKNSTQANAGR